MTVAAPPVTPEPSPPGGRGTVRPARRRRRTALWTSAATAATLLLLVGVLATREPASNARARSPLLGRAAPGIDAPTLDGGSFRLSDHRGRFVLINFFNSWCVPCREEHPELLKLHQRHQAAGDAVLVGVIHDDDPAAVRAWRSQVGGDWPVVDDPRGLLALEYGVRGQPETFVVDPDGVVIARYVSAVTADGVDRLLRQARTAR